MTTIKKEGFHLNGSFAPPPRATFQRQPFSDGSMAIETDMLASLMSPPLQTQPMASPFNFAQSLPTHSFDYAMTSPNNIGLNLGSPPLSGFQPSSLFSGFKFGNEHPEPPITLPVSASNHTSNRSRSQSSSRSSNIGKAPSSRSRPARKLSMNEARPPVTSNQPRGRSIQPIPSSHYGLGLDTHKEGETTDSVSPPEFGYSPYGMSMPLRIQQRSAWNGSSSVPSVMTGSFGTTADEATSDSPVTPAQNLPPLPSDDMSKKQRRRECHNQVEKRRREHINAKIEELSQLVPASYGNDDDMDDDDDEDLNAEGNIAKKKKTKRANSTTKHSKDSVQCKGRILTQSVQYIRDLKRLTDFQANRISHLEAMLSAANPHFQPSTVPVQSAPMFWSNNDNGHEHSFSFPDHAGGQLGGGHHATDAERLVSLEQLGIDSHWNNSFHSHPQKGPSNTGLMSFEPSPTDHSSGSAELHRRSSSLGSSSGSHEEDSKEGMMGMIDFVSDEASRNRQSIGAFDQSEDTRGRQRERNPRKDSQTELQAGMNGMDLETMFANGRREDDHGGMRW